VIWSNDIILNSDNKCGMWLLMQIYPKTQKGIFNCLIDISTYVSTGTDLRFISMFFPSLYAKIILQITKFQNLQIF
jgi:hypothetical protein